jgi:hypothetical protein
LLIVYNTFHSSAIIWLYKRSRNMLLLKMILLYFNYNYLIKRCVRLYNYIYICLIYILLTSTLIIIIRATKDEFWVDPALGGAHGHTDEFCGTHGRHDALRGTHVRHDGLYGTPQNLCLSMTLFQPGITHWPTCLFPEYYRWGQADAYYGLSEMDRKTYSWEKIFL